MKILVAILLPLLLSFTPQRPVTHEKNFERYFNEYKVKGSFLLYNLNNNEYISYNPERCKKGFLPASTFKIINSLIGLETGVITDENFVIPWDGVSRREAWNQDHSLKSAFKVSCVPYYQELARRVGEKKMIHYVTKAKYGKMVVKDGLDKFWLEGDSRISQQEQIDFLVRLYKNKLPFSDRSLRIVKDIMLVDESTIYKLRGKTGWAINKDGLNIGWFVGYLEQNGNIYFFATNIESQNPDDILFMNGRRAITEKILKELKLL